MAKLEHNANAGPGPQVIKGNVGGLRLQAAAQVLAHGGSVMALNKPGGIELPVVRIAGPAVLLIFDPAGWQDFSKLLESVGIGVERATSPAPNPLDGSLQRGT